MTKICTNKKDCKFEGKPQPPENFYKNLRFPDNLSNECKSCKYVRQKKWNDRKKQDTNNFFKLLLG